MQYITNAGGTAKASNVVVVQVRRSGPSQRNNVKWLVKRELACAATIVAGHFQRVPSISVTNSPQRTCVHIVCYCAQGGYVWTITFDPPVGQVRAGGTRRARSDSRNVDGPLAERHGTAPSASTSTLVHRDDGGDGTPDDEGYRHTGYGTSTCSD